MPTPTHNNRASVPIPQHIRPRPQPAFGGSEVIDFTKTPRSLEIRRDENGILRMPDSVMMYQAQQDFHDMLEDIHEDPNGFTNYITDRRDVLTTDTASSLPLPEINLQAGAISNYSGVTAVGKGRFSTVFQCRSVKSGEQLALKKIKLSSSNSTGNSTDKNFLTKCLKEVGLLRSISHPNIVKYQDSFLEGDDTLYIVLEWAGGGDLKGLIGKQRSERQYLLEKDVWSYFCQCAEAIRHMHHNRIIHRDIKPSNVLLMGDGRLKLGDLGLGRYLGSDSVLAFSQVGTPLYMSPEVLRGDGHDFASDVWSLGCLLYEITMLKTPFQQKGLTMDKLFGRIVAGEYPPIPSPPFSPSLNDLAADMILVDARRRPEIDEVAAAALLNRTRSSLVGSAGDESAGTAGSEDGRSEDGRSEGRSEDGRSEDGRSEGRSSDGRSSDGRSSDGRPSSATSDSRRDSGAGGGSGQGRVPPAAVASGPRPSCVSALPLGGGGGICRADSLPSLPLARQTPLPARQTPPRVSFGEVDFRSPAAEYDAEELRLMDELTLSARGEELTREVAVPAAERGRSQSVAAVMGGRLPPMGGGAGEEGPEGGGGGPYSGGGGERGGGGFLRRLSGMIRGGRRGGGLGGGGGKGSMGKEDVKRLKEERKKEKRDKAKADAGGGKELGKVKEPGRRAPPSTVAGL
ncbi:hypothetical protein TeGR_g4223 [Tetraparma gracilis]|uniref:non-specific serine/threonine protein kinase n=1 Tax=Tetraparma gracilis TaxID=2962635 RepID=A0ABQ6M4R1_9STRA|nr:hypothetical protein TeGR_g4223 [Tetraparma gracilis]